MPLLRRIVPFLVVLSACAPAVPLPDVPRPPVVQRHDALPELPESTLSVPIGLPVSELEALLRERVPLPNAADFVQVTEPGESPEVAVRYATAFLAPSLASEGDTLLASLPIAYYGAIRARAKTPFGWVWLTKGTDWGRPDAQGRIALLLAARAEVGDDWSLSTHTTLRDVLLTPPPVAQLCTRALFKLCVPAEWATTRIHRELDRRVRGEVVEGLARLDEQVRARAKLAGLADEVWRRLQRAQTVAGSDAALVLAPRALGIAAPSLRGDTLVADLHVWCRPEEGAPRALVPLASPAREPVQADAAALRMRLTQAAFTGAFARRLAASPVPLGDDLRVTGVALLGPAEEADRYLLAVSLADDAREPVLYVRASLRGDGARLVIAEPVPTPESERLLAVLGVRADVLVAALTQAVYGGLEEPLGARVSALSGLLADAVSPLPSTPLADARPAITGVHAAGDALVLDLRVDSAR